MSDNIIFEVIEPVKEEIETPPKIITSSNEFPPLDIRIADYIKQHNPKLYILTPCFASLCYVSYVTSLMSTIEFFKQINFPLKIEFCRNDSLVSRARNNLVARALSDPETTHILFIDNDITWNPIDIIKLVLAEKDLVGGVYPLKHYEWNKLRDEKNSNVIEEWIKTKNNSKLLNTTSDVDIIQHNLLNYNVNYIDSYLSIDKNVAKVKHVATGFMMIRREVFTKMMRSFPSTKYTDDVGFLRPEENENAYALFDCGVEDGHYFSEDWLFCSRWSKLGGEIYIDVTINLIHTGIEDYKGCYISSII